MYKIGFLSLLLLLSASFTPACAQFEKIQPEEGSSKVVLGTSQTTKYTIGLKIEATGGDCVGLLGTIPVPADWPEQSVKLVSEEISPSVRVKYVMLENSVKQMNISISKLRRGERAFALITVEVEKFSTEAPQDTSKLVIPKKVPRTLALYLGASPFINSRHSGFRKQAAVITKEIENDWAKVKAIYDWTRANVNHVAQEPTDAVTAIRDGKGDFEDVTGVFIALCRASKIPARTVWIPDSSYAEFYLEDEAGQGSWYPAQVAGPEAFGYIPTHEPILQKGDNFKVAEKSNRIRFVSEYLTGKRMSGKPTLKFVRESGGN
ncbi:MAG: transglutaminase-like domain-containing protein [Pirellulales bacterium]